MAEKSIPSGDEESHHVTLLATVHAWASGQRSGMPFPGIHAMLGGNIREGLWRAQKLHLGHLLDIFMQMKG